MSADDQRKLARKAARGDEAATEALILTNLRFIIGRAAHIGRGQHLDALVQAGMIGMLEAIRRYRPSRSNGGAFITYAGYWVVLYMVNEFGKLKVGPVRVPRRLMKAYRDGRLPEDERSRVEAAFAGPAALLPKDTSETPTDAVDSRLDAAALMEHLGPRDQEIVRMRFMEELTEAEIARRFRLSRQRVDQIVGESITKMRRAAFFVPRASAWQTATATL